MRRFCLQHLFVIFSLCLVATSSYVLFDLLDIDGSNLKEHARVCGFEAVLPAYSGEIKLAGTSNPAPRPTTSPALLFTVARFSPFGLRAVLPSIPRSLVLRIRRAIRVESTSLARGSDPASRSV